MERTETNENLLRGASRGAENAINAAWSPEFSHIPAEEKTAWAMAAMIHCDVSRLLVAFDECEREGVARLLWMADIVSNLLEAKRWYFEKGNRLLQDIAKNKACGPEVIRKRLRDIRKMHPIQDVDKYADYRNKFGYHYDADALDYLQRFSKEPADPFFDLLNQFVLFSKEWVQLTRSLIKNELTNPGYA